MARWSPSTVRREGARAAWLGLLVVLLLMQPLPGHAEDRALEPVSSTADARCQSSPAGRCDDPFVSQQDGGLDAVSSVESPLGGAAPGTGYSDVVQHIYFKDEVPDFAASVDYAFTFEVSEALVEHTGLLHGLPPNSDSSGARVRISGYAFSLADCSSGGFNSDLATTASGGPLEVSGPVTVHLLLTNGSCGETAVSPGEIVINLTVDVLALLDGATPEDGMVRAQYKGALTSVAVAQTPVS